MGVCGQSTHQPSPRNLVFSPRHLQRFWGASGHFWQAQWERLLLTYEGKEWILFVTGELPDHRHRELGVLTLVPFPTVCPLLWGFSAHYYKEEGLQV